MGSKLSNAPNDAAGYPSTFKQQKTATWHPGARLLHFGRNPAVMTLMSNG
jgi:hypothetical protein